MARASASLAFSARLPRKTRPTRNRTATNANTPRPTKSIRAWLSAYSMPLPTAVAKSSRFISLRVKCCVIEKAPKKLVYTPAAPLRSASRRVCHGRRRAVHALDAITAPGPLEQRDFRIDETLAGPHPFDVQQVEEGLAAMQQDQVVAQLAAQHALVE